MPIIIIRLLIPVVLVNCLTFRTGIGEGKKENRVPQSGMRTRLLAINRIWMNTNDHGSLSDPTGLAGAMRIDPWRGGAMQGIVYDQGPWIIGKVNNGPAAGLSYWGTSYSPGPIIDGRPGLDVRPQDSLRYHPYRISSYSSPSDPDMIGWPADLGAPTDASGQPKLLGDELVWSVFNAADSMVFPQAGRYKEQGLLRLSVEIQQSIYAAEGGETDTSLMANTVFIEWTFINKGTAVIESCYTALWTDIDFDNEEFNFPGVDTGAQVGYCWDGLAVPNSSPYAVGYVLLYGPVVPDPSHNALFRGRSRPGYRNLPLTSFWGILNDADAGNPNWFYSGPQTIEQAWNIARGFDRTGKVIIDSVAGVPTHFPYNGDPITMSGWVYNRPIGKNSAGFMMFSGPFTLAPQDTQWMMIALVPALGSDRFESIRILRQDATRLRSMSYDSIIVARAKGLSFISPVYATSYSLSQNYPNPFNPSTTIHYGLPNRSQVTLTVYNTLGQQVAVLQNGEQEAGYHEVQFDGSKLASGVYLYRIQAGSYVETKRLLLIR